MFGRPWSGRWTFFVSAAISREQIAFVLNVWPHSGRKRGWNSPVSSYCSNRMGQVSASIVRKQQPAGLLQGCNHLSKRSGSFDDKRRMFIPVESDAMPILYSMPVAGCTMQIVSSKHKAGTQLLKLSCEQFAAPSASVARTLESYKSVCETPPHH